MNRILLVGITCIWASMPHPAWAERTPLQDARQRMLKGNYAEALEAYDKLRGDEKTRLAGTLGYARTLRAQGELHEALLWLDIEAKEPALAKHPDIRALRATLHYELGQWDEAIKEVQLALQIQREHLLARWVQAQILRDQGQLDKADAEMRWFVRYYSQRSDNDNDIKDPDELLIIAQAGAENARWHNLSDQFSFILNDVLGDALKYDPDLWEAEYHIGSMLLEKYNKPDALDAFNKALKLNAKAAPALVGKAMAALQGYDLKDAEQYAIDALKLHPRLTAALRLRADVLMAGGEFEESAKLLDLAVQHNPREVATRGRQAAIAIVQKNDKRFQQIVTLVEAFDQKPGLFYYELAGALEDRKYYTQAEKYYLQAIALRPQVPAARCALGLLSMRLGQEKKGREILQEAFAADPFHVRVANTLKVMRHLDGYVTKRTPHFELRYDAKTDGLLAEFMSEHLEEVYAELAKLFQYEPPVPILIEVFKQHEMFSGRTIGVPDLHTIGACTGRVIVMASTHAEGVRSPFNWSRVIRHELVHIFNLAQTEFQVPHWLTEGLAVRNEGAGRPPSWITLLAQRIQKDELLNLDTIMLGFVRPRSPDEWTLAYCQSELYVEHIIRTFGEDKIAALLAAYRDGADTRAALKSVLGVDQESFEKSYRAYLVKVAEPAKDAAPAEKNMSFTELQVALKESPDDADLNARLAEQYLRRERNREARKLVESALAKEPQHPLSTIVKAKLMMLAGSDNDARILLVDALAKHPNDLKLLRAVAGIHLEAKEYEEAIPYLQRARKIAPLDTQWVVQLVAAYQKLGKRKELLPLLRELADQDYDDAEARYQWAKLALEAGDFVTAEAAARAVLYIDVKHAKIRPILYEALEKQGKVEELKRFRVRFGE